MTKRDAMDATTNGHKSATETAPVVATNGSGNGREKRKLQELEETSDSSNTNKEPNHSFNDTAQEHTSPSTKKTRHDLAPTVTEEAHTAALTTTSVAPAPGSSVEPASIPDPAPAATPVTTNDSKSPGSDPAPEKPDSLSAGPTGSTSVTPVPAPALSAPAPAPAPQSSGDLLDSMGWSTGGDWQDTNLDDFNVDQFSFGDNAGGFFDTADNTSTKAKADPAQSASPNAGATFFETEDNTSIEKQPSTTDKEKDKDEDTTSDKVNGNNTSNDEAMFFEPWEETTGEELEKTVVKWVAQVRTFSVSIIHESLGSCAAPVHVDW